LISPDGSETEKSFTLAADGMSISGENGAVFKLKK
jgi:hypothetical protein